MSSSVTLSLETKEDSTVMLDVSSWNEYSVARCEEERDAGPMHEYCASKVLAERAACDFYKNAKSELTKGEKLEWNLEVFCPVFVFGRMVHEVPSLETFWRTPADGFKAVVKDETAGTRQPAKFGFDFVDVRNVARAFVLGLEKEEAGGERFTIQGGGATWQDFIIAARRYPDKIPAYEAEDVFYPLTYTAEKSIRLLGVQYRTLEAVTRDSLEDFEARGWMSAVRGA